MAYNRYRCKKSEITENIKNPNKKNCVILRNKRFKIFKF